jgi:hypothetical protein
MVELALGDREMVRLMHRTAHQAADKTKAANTPDFLRIGRGGPRKDTSPMFNAKRGRAEVGGASSVCCT